MLKQSFILINVTHIIPIDKIMPILRYDIFLLINNAQPYKDIIIKNIMMPLKVNRLGNKSVAFLLIG